MKEYILAIFGIIGFYLIVDVVFSYSKIGVGTVVTTKNLPDKVETVTEPFMPYTKTIEVLDGKELIIIPCSIEIKDTVVMYRIVYGGAFGTVWSVSMIK